MTLFKKKSQKVPVRHTSINFVKSVPCLLRFTARSFGAAPDGSFFSVVDGKWRDGKYVCEKGDRVPAPGRAGLVI